LDENLSVTTIDKQTILRELLFSGAVRFLIFASKKLYFAFLED